MTKLTQIDPKYLPEYEYHILEKLKVSLFYDSVLNLSAFNQVLEFVEKYEDSCEFDVDCDMDTNDNTVTVLISAGILHTPETLQEYENQKEKRNKDQAELQAKFDLKQLNRLIAIYGVPKQES